MDVDLRFETPAGVDREREEGPLKNTEDVADYSMR